MFIKCFFVLISMYKKILLLVLLFFSLIYLSFGATPISNCTEITTSGDYYLTQDLTLSSAHGTLFCISLNTDNINLDCKNFTIDSSTEDEYGIYVYGKDNKVSNCNLVDFEQMLVVTGQRHHIENISLITAKYKNLDLRTASDSNFKNFYISQYDGGDGVGGSSYDNNFSNIECIFDVPEGSGSRCFEITGSNNLIRDSRLGNDIMSPADTILINVTDIDDPTKYFMIFNSPITIDGWTNISNLVLGSGAVGSIIRNLNLTGIGKKFYGITIKANNVLLENLNVSNFEKPISLSYANYTQVKNVNVKDCYEGFGSYYTYFSNFSNVKVENSVSSDAWRGRGFTFYRNYNGTFYNLSGFNTNAGMWFNTYNDYNIFDRFNFSYNKNGFEAYTIHNNTFQNGVFSNNGHGLYFEDYSYGKDNIFYNLSFSSNADEDISLPLRKYNNSYYGNYLNKADIQSRNSSRTDYLNYDHPTYGNLGNYWTGFTCLETIKRGPFFVCSNPATYTINSLEKIYDNAPLWHEDLRALFVEPTVQCENNSVWINCSNLKYKDTLTKIRVNCTSNFPEYVTDNISIKLSNIPDSNEYFDQLILTKTNGWYEYDLIDLFLNNSGLYEFEFLCYNNNSDSKSYYSNFTIPFGSLEVDLISPNSNVTINNGTFFNFSSRVRCIGGECGNINFTLDPIEDGYLLSDLESDFGNWSNAGGDDFDWTRKTGSTGSTNTGPTSAHAGSYYVYTEASSPNFPSKRAILESDDLSLFGIESISFWYHFYGSTMGTIDLEYYDGSSWTSVWSLTGDQGNSWQYQLIDLSSYNIDKLRFNAVTGSNYYSDFSLDNINLTLGASSSKGGVIPMNGGSPFYTITQNPHNNLCLQSMSDGDECEVTWKVFANATNTSYKFFTIADPTQYGSYIPKNYSKEIYINISVPNLFNIKSLIPNSTNSVEATKGGIFPIIFQVYNDAIEIKSNVNLGSIKIGTQQVDLVNFTNPYIETIFSDDGEGWLSGNCGHNGLWDFCNVNQAAEDGDLIRDTASYQGIYSVRADDFDSPGGDNTLIKQLDLSSCVGNVTVSFWYYAARLDAADYGTLKINDDGSWKEIIKVGQSESFPNTASSAPTNPSNFTYYEKDITLDYDFSSPVNFSWSYFMAGGGETMIWDNFNISCLKESTQEIQYEEGTGWRANVKVPTSLSGLQDLELRVSTSSNNLNRTEFNAVDLVEPVLEYIYPTPYNSSKLMKDVLTINVSSNIVPNSCTLNVGSDSYAMIVFGNLCYYNLTLPETITDITFNVTIDSGSQVHLENRTFTFYPDHSMSSLPAYNSLSTLGIILLIIVGGFFFL